MNGFWWIIMFNWTLEERSDLRAFVETWMAADHSFVGAGTNPNDERTSL